MKFKSLIFSALCLSAVAFTSCDGEKEAAYVPAQPVEVPEVYFNLGDDSTLINLGDTDTDVKFTLYRKNATGTLTTSLSYTAVTYKANAENPNKVAADKTLFNVPSSVTFADGKNDVEITMTLDPTLLDANNIYEVTFTVGDGEVTPYFSQVLAYKLKYNPFENVIGPNGETKAVLLDFLMTTWFNVPTDTEFEVQLQKSPAIEGLYRLVNPYGMDYPYNEDGDVDGKVHYLYFNAANPKAVFMCNASGDALENDGTFPIYATGMSWNWTDYGEVLVTGLYNLRMAQNNEAEANKNVGTLEEGILTFAPKTWLARMDIYTTPGNWSYAATNGFYLRWPGVEEPEPEPGPEPDEEWVGIGECEYTDVYIYPMFGVTDVSWGVEVEKNTKTPGVFRMVNPYKDGVMPDGTDYSGNLYIEIDCTDPDLVMIPLQNTGCILDEDGAMQICNKGWFYVVNQGQSADAVIANGFNDTYLTSTYNIVLNGLNAFVRWPDATSASTDPNSLYVHNTDVTGGLVMNSQAAAQAKMSIATARTTPSHFSKLLVKAGFNVDKPTKIKKHAVKKIDSKIVVK